uniref:Putative ovule protein n=1 Tax=Solanum chacoense TaxID=4108 RepID=A0A0V0HQ14_SOLCH
MLWVVEFKEIWRKRIEFRRIGARKRRRNKSAESGYQSASRICSSNLENPSSRRGAVTDRSASKIIFTTKNLNTRPRRRPVSRQ